MTPEERKILRLEDKVKNLELALEHQQIKNGSLQAENKSLIISLKEDNNGEYIFYLQKSLRMMESLHVDQNRTIESYIKHFNRFRTIYESKETETMI